MLPDLNDPYPSPLSSNNFGEIYTTPNTWFVDDTNVQIATKQKTNNATDNGAVLMFNPQTGHVLMKVIDMTEFATAQGRLSIIADWRTSEEIAAIVRGFPAHQRPKQIILTRVILQDYLKFHLQDSPDIIIRGCQLPVPLYASFVTEKLGNLHNGLNSSASEKPLMVSLNMYDAWLSEGLTPYTAFCRLILICRALAVNCQKAKMLLKPADCAEVVTRVDKIWPSLTSDQWCKVETSLKSLIFSEFEKKTSNLQSSLLQSQNRDTLLGIQTTTSATQ